MAGKISTALAKSGADKNLNLGIGLKNTDGTRRSSRQDFMDDMHLYDYFLVLKKNRWIIALVFLIIVGTVSAISFLLTPTYESTAQILLGGQPTPMNPLGDSSERIPERALLYSTQVNLLKSRTLVQSVIEALKLERVYPSESKRWKFQLLGNQIRQNAAMADGSIENSETPDLQDNISAVMNWYLNNLHISPIRDSSLVNISFTGKNPALTTEIANKHAEIALQNTVKLHQSRAKDALDWLREQIADQKTEVETTQRAIYDFKKRYNVLSMEDSTTALSQEIRDLNTALTEAKSERIAKQAIYYQLKQINDSKGDVLLMPEISNYTVIQALRSKLVDLKSEQLEMGTKYGPKHPRMRKLEIGIQKIQDEITIESNRLQKVIKAELDRAIDVENKFSQALERQKKIALSLGERGIEYEVIRQQAQSQQDVYNFLLKQFEEIGLSSAISSSNMRIIDKASVPIRPVKPKVMLNILGAVIFSLLAGSGLAFFIEYLDNSVKNPMDVVVRIGIPVLGMIPLHKPAGKKTGDNKKIKLLDSTKKSHLIESPIYHISNRLPAELRSPADGLFGKVLMIESVTMGEGKTSVISKIASNLSDAGLRVLLVDCDFQRPALNKIFNIRDNGGLGKALDRIMSHQLHKGTLKDYSVDDLFFMIALKKRSGYLSIRNEEQTYIAHFQNGILIHIQNQNSPPNNRIGTMLLKGGFITEEQLKDALQRHQRTSQPLGYILVNAGYIGREKLRGPLRLQIEEYIQKLFSWKNGEFVFKPGSISIYNNEKIFFEEDYTPYINSLGRMEASKFIENELFGNIINLPKENMYLMPAGTSYKLIGSLNQVLMRKVFEKLKHHFDVVLVDTPPLDSASGIESIFQLSDGIVLVIKAGHLSIKVLNGAINHLPEDKIIGAVLNQVKMEVQPYYF